MAARKEPNYPEPELRIDAKLGTEGLEGSDVFGELRITLEAERSADAKRRENQAIADPTLGAAVPVSRKVAFTVLSLWLLVGLPYAHPALAKWRLLSTPEVAIVEDAPSAAGGPLPAASMGEAKLPGETFDQQSRAKELEARNEDRGPIAKKKTDLAVALNVGKEKKPPRSIEDPSGKALDRFFAKLQRVEKKEPGAVARVLYYGDSIVASDFVTGQLRRRLQSRFGDAGHGYALIANAWPGWFHIDVARAASSEWHVSTCVGPYAEDGIYGLGCASFQAHSKGVWSTIGTAELAEWGRSVSKFELEFLKQPGGGTLTLTVDDGKSRELSTDGEKALAWESVLVPDGAHKLTLRTLDDKPVRLFGVRMERDVPGITLSACGITGARARFLDKQDDEQFAAILKAAKPDLVVLAFGSNEITDGTMVSMESYRETLSAVMAQVEKAVPEAARMLAGPPDMASSNPSQGRSRPMVHFITENQKKVTAERGWAFWDQYRAMGGGGSMWSWIQAGLGSPDMFHPTGQGGTVLGNWEYLALMEAYDAYRAHAGE